MKQMMKSLTLMCMTLLLANGVLMAQNPQNDSTYRKHFIGSSMFIFANFIPYENPPSFYQLNYGYRLTPKDVVSIEAITWTFGAPLGIPYGPSYELATENYPGSVKSFGLALAYQRFLWKNFYTAVHAASFLQTYRNERQEKIQNGYQLFCTFRLGYHLPLFKNRFFIEPSIAATYWPINTNMPESFKKMESKWSNYFLFEPGLHFGVKF
jgi:hypothetical protein